MTKYEYYISKSDYYTREARRQYTRNRIKSQVFASIAQDYKEKALRLTIERALK